MGQLRFDLEVTNWLARDNIPLTAATSDAFRFYHDVEGINPLAMVAIVHDNAKNLKNASKNTGVIENSLACFNHNLQLTINGATDEVPEMNKVVTSFPKSTQMSYVKQESNVS